jgi:hypothetical protein
MENIEVARESRRILRRIQDDSASEMALLAAVGGEHG